MQSSEAVKPSLETIDINTSVHHNVSMRTTLTIDDDLMEAARALAVQRRAPLGKIVSELMRKGIQGGGRIKVRRKGFPVFRVSKNASPITLEIVKKAEEV